MLKNKGLIFIFITIFIDLVGFGIVIPILPIYATDFGATPSQIGLLVASFSFMQFISSPILGRLSDRFGRNVVLSLSLFGTAVGFLVTGLAKSLTYVFIGRIIDGITGGTISTAQAYVADVTEKKDRARGMGMVGAAFGLGFIIGPAIGGILSQFSVSTPFIFVAAMALLNSLGVQLYLPEVKRKTRADETTSLFSVSSIKQAFKPIQVGAFIVIFFLINLAFSMIHGTLPLLTEIRFRWHAVQNGYFFALFGLVSAITQLVLIGKLTDRFGELKVGLGGFILLACGLSIAGFATLVPLLLLGAAIMAFGNGLANPSIQALISRYSSQEEQGGVLGISQGFGSLARTFGPIYGGFVFQHLGSAAPYYSGGLLFFIIFLISSFAFTWLSIPTKI